MRGFSKRDLCDLSPLTSYRSVQLCMSLHNIRAASSILTGQHSSTPRTSGDALHHVASVQTDLQQLVGDYEAAIVSLDDELHVLRSARLLRK